MEQSVQAVIFVPILNCCKKRMELFKESQNSSLQAASIDLPHVCGYVWKLLCYIYGGAGGQKTTVILSKY